MSETEETAAGTQAPALGKIGWADLTVPNADEVRDFYRDVVGWTPVGLDMGGYQDYVMNTPSTGEAAAGICHARGVNAELPPQWLVYLTVENLDASIAKVREHGGAVISGPRSGGGTARYCVVRDPAGAVCALYQA